MLTTLLALVRRSRSELAAILSFSRHLPPGHIMEGRSEYLTMPCENIDVTAASTREVVPLDGNEIDTGRSEMCNIRH